ncbi:hypothetical protein KBC04_02215 [Candidatus Babeliales bacterium]|nr:hypothetical protein [Candidatus Babeliales bacterium]MBP9843777.1 hypothetical protein [Candidatus Babeliales bacterium]
MKKLYTLFMLIVLLAHNHTPAENDENQATNKSVASQTTETNYCMVNRQNIMWLLSYITYPFSATSTQKDETLQNETAIENSEHATSIQERLWSLLPHVTLPKNLSLEYLWGSTKDSVSLVHPEILIAHLQEKLSVETAGSFDDLQALEKEIQTLEASLNSVKHKGLALVASKKAQAMAEYEQRKNEVANLIKSQLKNLDDNFFANDEETQNSLKNSYDNKKADLEKNLLHAVSILEAACADNIATLEIEAETITKNLEKYRKEHGSFVIRLEEKFNHATIHAQNQLIQHLENLKTEHERTFFEHAKNSMNHEAHQATEGSSYKFHATTKHIQCTDCLEAESLLKLAIDSNEQASQVSKEALKFIARTMKNVASGVQQRIGEFDCIKVDSDLRCRRIKKIVKSLHESTAQVDANDQNLTHKND